MGRAMDVGPAAGIGFVLADFVAHLGMKDFGPAPRQAAQPGGDHLFQDRADRAAGHPREPIDFDRGPGFEVQPGIRLVQDAHQVHVPLIFHLVMQAADDVHLGGAAIDRLLPASQDLLVGHQIALGAAQVAAEGAEHAAIDADVGRIEVRVDVVVGEVAVLPLADQVGQFAHLAQRHVGAIQKQALVERQALAGLDLVADRIDCRFGSANHRLDFQILEIRVWPSG